MFRLFRKLTNATSDNGRNVKNREKISGGGALQKNILRAKNMQNLGRFRTTSNFGGEYLQNE